MSDSRDLLVKEIGRYSGEAPLRTGTVLLEIGQRRLDDRDIFLKDGRY